MRRIYLKTARYFLINRITPCRFLPNITEDNIFLKRTLGKFPYAPIINLSKSESMWMLILYKAGKYFKIYFSIEQLPTWMSFTYPPSSRPRKAQSRISPTPKPTFQRGTKITNSPPSMERVIRTVHNTSTHFFRTKRRSYPATTSNLSSARRATSALRGKKPRRKPRRKTLISSTTNQKLRPRIYRRDIGLLKKTNFTTGSWNSTTVISFLSTFADLTKSSKLWPISSGPERHSSAGATTKKCRKSTTLFTKF